MKMILSIYYAIKNIIQKKPLMEGRILKNEWRVPLVLNMFSALIFVAVTFAIGFNINRITGELIITFGISQSVDAWSYDPMSVIWGDLWRYWCLAGYFGSIAMFNYAWFAYMKWIKENEVK